MVETCLSILRERIDDEPFGSQLRAFEISARQTRTADPELAGRSGSNWLLVLIENVKLRIRNRHSEGDLLRRRNAVDGRPNRSFGRPIHVPECAAMRNELAGEVWSKRLAPAKNS